MRDCRSEAGFRVVRWVTLEGEVMGANSLESARGSMEEVESLYDVRG